MVSFTSDQWVIVALVFVLGLLIGAFLTSGGRRKWKARYREESDRREALEREHRDHIKRTEVRDTELRSADRDRADSAVERRTADRRAAERRTGDRRDSDFDGDGVRDDIDRRPTDDRKA